MSVLSSAIHQRRRWAKWLAIVGSLCAISAVAAPAVAVAVVKFRHRSPASPCTVSSQGCAGEEIVYGLTQSTLGFHGIFDTRTFSIGPMKSVSFKVGADGYLANKFTGAPAKGIAAGLQFAFDRPYEGYFDISPLLYKQWVYSGLPWTGFEPGLAHGTLDLNLTWAPEANYYVPLGFLPDTIPLATSGRMQIMDEGGGVTLWANCPPTCFREEAKHFGLKSIPTP